jgi:carboxymethylenebutenolidase
MPDSHHLQHHISSGFIRVVTDVQTYVPAFWAHPVHGGPFPGLVLLHDDWGLQAVARATAHRLAESGYYVIVPDLFEGNRADAQIQADALEARYKPSAPPKVNAGLEALRTHPRCNRKIALVGWDLGADIGLRLALEHDDIMAAVLMSGDPGPFLGQLDQLQCPVMAILGGLDPLSRHAEPFRAELAATDARHQVVQYPNAHHAFYNHVSPEYNPDISELAFETLLQFLEEHQGKPPAPTRAKPGYFHHGRVY